MGYEPRILADVADFTADYASELALLDGANPHTVYPSRFPMQNV